MDILKSYGEPCSNLTLCKPFLSNLKKRGVFFLFNSLIFLEFLSENVSFFTGSSIIIGSFPFDTAYLISFIKRYIPIHMQAIFIHSRKKSCLLTFFRIFPEKESFFTGSTIIIGSFPLDIAASTSLIGVF